MLYFFGISLRKSVVVFDLGNMVWEVWGVMRGDLGWK